MNRLHRALCGAALLILPLTQAHAQPKTTITEIAHLTFYVEGGYTHSGVYTQEGYTVGCGWDVPDFATATMESGETYLCADKGATWGPWIDYYTPSYDRGYAWLAAHSDWCDASGCYAYVTYSW